MSSSLRTSEHRDSSTRAQALAYVSLLCFNTCTMKSMFSSTNSLTASLFERVRLCGLFIFVLILTLFPRQQLCSPDWTYVLYEISAQSIQNLSTDNTFLRNLFSDIVDR